MKNVRGWGYVSDTLTVIIIIIFSGLHVTSSGTRNAMLPCTLPTLPYLILPYLVRTDSGPLQPWKATSHSASY